MYGKPNRQLGAYQMSVQVPHRVLSKVPEKNIRKGYRQDLKGIIQRLCRYKGVGIPEGHMMPDHGHLLLSIPPNRSVSSVTGCLKGGSGYSKTVVCFCVHRFVRTPQRKNGKSMDEIRIKRSFFADVHEFAAVLSSI